MTSFTSWKTHLWFGPKWNWYDSLFLFLFPKEIFHTGRSGSLLDTRPQSTYTKICVFWGYKDKQKDLDTQITAQHQLPEINFLRWLTLGSALRSLTEIFVWCLTSGLIQIAFWILKKKRLSTVKKTGRGFAVSSRVYKWDIWKWKRKLLKFPLKFWNS